MEKAIIGKKIGMTQIFDEAGKVIPVTLIQAGPCTVVQKKTAEKDGYEAIQLGYQTVPERKLTKPELGHQKKAGLEELKKVLKEFALNDGTPPGHIYKGRDGAGQMGNVQVTVQNLDVVQVDEELGLIAVRGAIPGPKGGVVFVKSTVKTNVEKKAAEIGRVNPQKASARVNPQKASARNK